MTSQTTTRVRYPRPARPRWRHPRGAHAAALSLTLTLTAAAASGVAATPAWAAGGYHITATIGVGYRPVGVTVSPDGARAYVGNAGSGSVSVINTATIQVAATIHGLCSPSGVAVSPDSTHIYVTNEMEPGTVSVITRQ